MDEERKKLEACGDGLLLAVARLYLKDHPSIPYKIHMRLISRMVNNQTLCEIATAEVIRGREGEKLSDAFEVAIALHYYRHGFRSLRLWLSGLFDKYLDIAGEVRRILEPTPDDKLTTQVRGALKMVIGQQGGKITGSTLDLATKQIVAQLRNGTGVH
jgi:dsRNA-specific ribonuclease